MSVYVCLFVYVYERSCGCLCLVGVCVLVWFFMRLFACANLVCVR